MWILFIFIILVLMHLNMIMIQRKINLLIAKLVELIINKILKKNFTRYKFISFIISIY